MSWSSAAPEPVGPMRRERIRRPGLTGAGITLLVLGLLVGLASGLEISLSIARPLTETFTNPIRQTPVNAPVQLSKGRYVVFELTGQTGDDSGAGGNLGSGDAVTPTVTPGHVSVVGPDGRALTVSGPGNGWETITRQQDVYVGAAHFTVPQEGLYQVRVKAPNPVPVIISPSLTSGFFRAWPWFLTGTMSSLSVLSGIVLLILGRRRRVVIRGGGPGSAPPGSGLSGSGLSGQALPVGQQAVGVHYPPGWYTDPVGAGRMRYWDGRTWVNDAQ